MTTAPLTGRMPSFVAGVIILGGLPLLAFILLFWRLMAAPAAGHAGGGDALGLAIMSLLSYFLALLSFAIGAAYYGYQHFRHRQRLQNWQAAIFVWCLLELLAPPLYMIFT